jgi:DNA-binding protein H-NS
MSELNEVVAGKDVSELDALIAAAEAEKAAAKERAKDEFYALVEKVKSEAEKFGFKLKDVFFPKPEKPAKLYKNPNGDETWSGKGKKPGWLNALLEGKTKEEAKEAMKAYLVA